MDINKIQNIFYKYITNLTDYENLSFSKIIDICVNIPIGRELLKGIAPKDIIKIFFYIFLKCRGFSDDVVEFKVNNLFVFDLTEITSEANHLEDCENCNGRGYMGCEECYGSGNVECRDCNARGMIECNCCDGEGRDELGDDCDCCDGSGEYECDRCDGTGNEECSWCGGEGRFECSDCEGSGETENWEDYMDITVEKYVTSNMDLYDELVNYRKNNKTIEDTNDFLSEYINEIGILHYNSTDDILISVLDDEFGNNNWEIGDIFVSEINTLDSAPTIWSYRIYRMGNGDYSFGS